MEDRALKLVEEPAPVAQIQDSSLEALFRDQYENVFLAAYRVCGSTQDAEDVLQSVFLRLLKRAESDSLGSQNLISSLGSHPASYLCRAAINASLDLLRSKRRKPTSAIDEETLPIDSTEADSEAQRAEQRHHLRLALLNINERAAEVFVLRYFEEFSNAEIAEMLDTSSNSVAVTLHRTRDRLQELLREFGGESR